MKATFTLRTCTSVAGQIMLILRSRSRLSPNHPKSHVYYKRLSARASIRDRIHYIFFFKKKGIYNVCTFFQFNSLYISIFGEELCRIFRVECGFFNSYDCLNFVGGISGAREGAEKDDRVSEGILV